MINGHCECGRVQFSINGEIPDVFYVSMGAIDGDPPRPPGYHIYIGSKAPWHEITDDLPQHETEPGEWP